ncbi:MAG: nucleoside deaminase [Cyanobacteriota bacterium]|nr:nucleoside deaminase [Cyanobacteriota bacterium]
MSEPNCQFMEEAISQALNSVNSGKGGPFGAVIVKGGKIVAKAHNQVTLTNDPTAHAEIVAIRRACQALGTFQLRGCELYTSCEPCPMCFGAIYWARLDRVYYASTKEDAAAIGFDDRWIYEELEREPLLRQLPASQFMGDEALVAFQVWAEASNKIEY